MKNSITDVIRKYLMLSALALMAVAMVIAVPVGAGAANPGKREDAAAEREKNLRMSDTIEVVQANQELTRTELTEMKAEVEKLKTEVAAAKADNAALRAALEKSEQARQKEREVLLDEVAKMIAANSKKAPKSGSGAGTATTPAKPKSAQQGDGPSASREKEKETSEAPAPTPRPKTTENGFSHLVQKGQTLTLIAQAFREQGVNVSVDDIVKANDLPSREIKPGQKLFIPKK